ncbi:TolC family protein, partial [bacterium]|nr:TolC family protein [bacterium]
DSVEAKQSESQLLLVKQNLLQEVFRKKQIEDQIKVALSLEDLPYGYKPTEKMFIRQDHLDFDNLLKETYQNNQDLGLLAVALKMNSLSLKEAENRDRSDIDFSMQYKANGYGKDTTKASSGMSENDLHNYAVSLTWNVPLFDKVTPQTIRKVNLERSRIDLQVANVKSLLKVQLQSILRNLKLAEEGIMLANTSASLVNDMLEKETEKFNLGNSTSFRVAQVQQDLIDAQKNEILAKVQYEKTYLGLLVMTEKIFSVYSLTLR